jgi:hypothetical protein
MKELEIDSLKKEMKGGHRIVIDKMHHKVPHIEHDTMGLHLGIGHKKMHQRRINVDDEEVDYD